MRQTFASKAFGSQLEEEDQNKVVSAKMLSADARRQIIQNLQEDPTLYDYDKYLDAQEKKTQERTRPNFRAEPQKSKYQDKLIQRAEYKKLEREIYQDQLRDKQIKRETKTDDAPVAYVTESYKQFIEERRKLALRAESEVSKTISNGLAQFHKAQLGLQARHDSRGKVADSQDPNRTPSPERIPEKSPFIERDQGKIDDRTSSTDSIKLKEKSLKEPLALKILDEAPVLEKRTADLVKTSRNIIAEPGDGFAKQFPVRLAGYSQETKQADELSKEQKLLLARKKFEERKKVKTG